VAAALAASIFKENGIKEYCVASTGNTATAYSKYLAAANISFTVFVPENTDNETVEEIKSHKQNINIAKGDYAFAKKMETDFHTEHKVLMSAGNIDPIRVEAKRTMIFEFMRQMGKMPDVYIQAVSGGTGPIAIDKGVREIENIYPEVQLPRMLLIQQDKCDPMVQGWENAKKNNFPEGYEKNYPIIDNPQTMVSILSTGNPGMFPIVAPIVKKSKGTFLRIKESKLTHFARIVRDEKQILLGPASIVCLAGFYQALKEGQIKNGETVLINIGESAIRSSNFIKML
jgi:threonine synthase